MGLMVFYVLDEWFDLAFVSGKFIACVFLLARVKCNFQTLKIMIIINK